MKILALATGRRPQLLSPGASDQPSTTVTPKQERSAAPLTESTLTRPPCPQKQSHTDTSGQQAQVMFLHPGPRAAGNVFFWLLAWGVGTENGK